MRWLRDPIVLFLILGAGLVFLHAATREDDAQIARNSRIVVTDDDVRWLAVVFEKTWNRPPTQEELRSLVDRRVRDEMLYREAVALGLDQGDEALRRRVAMKLELLAKDVGGAVEPTDAELQAHLEANAERYAISPRRRFTQIFLDADKRGNATDADVRALLERLKNDPDQDIEQLGDVLMRAQRHPLSSPFEVEREFGRKFANALFALEEDGWQGPVVSGYGVHIVRIEESVAGEAPPLELVRARVRQDVLDARRTAALESYVEALGEKYEVELRTTLVPKPQE